MLNQLTSHAMLRQMSWVKTLTFKSLGSIIIFSIRKSMMLFESCRPNLPASGLLLEWSKMQVRAVLTNVDVLGTDGLRVRGGGGNA